ncbi:hypothetical protein [Paraburkholderia sp. EG304]|uniref:hypothetical protein n=1 Tax=Paraburkholderia sp. EG304 TaxID=3237015 RepID=UPI00397BB9BF
MSVALALTRRQRFLAECWYNLVHEASLDAFRVRTMNPGNAVRELRRVCDEAETEAYREQVAKEAYSILTTDQIVQESPVFQPVASDLAALLKNISG